MTIASIGQRTTNFTISQSCIEWRTNASVAKFFEISIIQLTGTAQSLALGRPQARGVTPAGTTVFQREDTISPACVTGVHLSWGTSPTVPLNFFRRWNSASTIGVGITWTFPRGLGMLINASLVVWNVTTAVAADINAVIDEP